jgi:hypothetical protein
VFHINTRVYPTGKSGKNADGSWEASGIRRDGEECNNKVGVLLFPWGFLAVMLGVSIAGFLKHTVPILHWLF